MSTKEVLQQARALITDPKCFLTGSLGNGQGAYCAVGAVLQATNGTTSAYDAWTVAQPLGELASLIDVSQATRDPHWGDLQLRGDKKEDDWKKVVNFNNTKGHECVLSLFDAAIARQP